jgi:UDP:flavonoid glycosyltransferase YjiC (YdhE family)
VNPRSGTLWPVSGRPSPAAQPVVILMTSNGAGMGHLARLAAVAGAAGSAGSGFAPLLLSMSTALPTVAAASGLPAEYCPGPARQWIRTDVWHRYLERRLVALVRESGATALVFDGTSPYPGLLAARRALPDLRLVWSRRGLWRADASRAPLRTTGYFDLVVEPGDLAGSADHGPTAGLAGTTHVGPVTLLETEPLLGRAQARAELGLDPDRPALLVSLGAGSINDPGAAMSAAVTTALAAPDWQVALTKAPIAWRELPDEVRARVTVLEGVYPLASYLAAFDAAVSAAGYNGVHELLLSGLPTLLVPNTATSTDDQVTRAAYVAEQGWALVAAEDDAAAVVAGVRELLGSDGAARRGDLTAATARLARPTGAGQTAALVGALAASGERRELPRDSYQPVRSASAVVRRAVGESAWEKARRLAGGPARQLGSGPLPVVETEGDVPAGFRRLLVTRDLAEVSATADVVVEHVLAGGSDAYLRARRGIIASSYPGSARDRSGDGSGRRASKGTA